MGLILKRILGFVRLDFGRGWCPCQGRAGTKKISAENSTTRQREQKQPPGVTQEAAVSIRTRQPPIKRHDYLIAADEHPVE